MSNTGTANYLYSWSCLKALQIEWRNLRKGMLHAPAWTGLPLSQWFAWYKFTKEPALPRHPSCSLQEPTFLPSVTEMRPKNLFLARQKLYSFLLNSVVINGSTVEASVHLPPSEECRNRSFWIFWASYTFRLEPYYLRSACLQPHSGSCPLVLLPRSPICQRCPLAPAVTLWAQTQASFLPPVIYHY